MPTEYGVFWDLAKGALLVEPIEGSDAREWFEHGTAKQRHLDFISGTPKREGGHQYTYVRNGNQHRIFIDREIAGTSLFDQGPNDTSETPCSIQGMVPDKNGTPFAGIIGEVRMYNRALAEFEVRSLFDAEFPEGHEVTVRSTYKNSVWTTAVDVNSVL